MLFTMPRDRLAVPQEYVLDFESVMALLIMKRLLDMVQSDRGGSSSRAGDVRISYDIMDLPPRKPDTKALSECVLDCGYHDAECKTGSAWFLWSFTDGNRLLLSFLSVHDRSSATMRSLQTTCTRT